MHGTMCLVAGADGLLNGEHRTLSDWTDFIQAATLALKGLHALLLVYQTLSFAESAHSWRQRA